MWRSPAVQSDLRHPDNRLEQGGVYRQRSLDPDFNAWTKGDEAEPLARHRRGRDITIQGLRIAACPAGPASGEWCIALRAAGRFPQCVRRQGPSHPPGARRPLPFPDAACYRRAACGGRRPALSRGRLQGSIKLSTQARLVGYDAGAAPTRTVLNLADDSSSTDVGARYAQALFDLAVETNALDPIEADLKSLKAMRAESKRSARRPGLAALFRRGQGQGPWPPSAQRAGFNPTTGKFLGLLAANGRTGALSEIIAAFERLSAKRRGAVSAQVTTAVPLTDAQTDSLRSALRTRARQGPADRDPGRSRHSRRPQGPRRLPPLRCFAEVEARLPEIRLEESLRRHPHGHSRR